MDISWKEMEERDEPKTTSWFFENKFYLNKC